MSKESDKNKDALPLDDANLWNQGIYATLGLITQDIKNAVHSTYWALTEGRELKTQRPSLRNSIEHYKKACLRLSTAIAVWENERLEERSENGQSDRAEKLSNRIDELYEILDFLEYCRDFISLSEEKILRHCKHYQGSFPVGTLVKIEDRARDVGGELAKVMDTKPSIHQDGFMHKVVLQENTFKKYWFHETHLVAIDS